MVTVRRATRKDKKKIHSLFMELADTQVGFEPIKITRKMLSERMNKMSDAVLNSKKAFCFIAEDGDKSIGFVTGFNNISRTRKTRYVEIGDMYVKKAYRNKGVGGMLAKAIEDESKKRKMTHLRMQVFCENTDAVEAYKSWDFKPTRYIMTKNLK